MQVTFAGVGEAFDETQPNTSLLVEAGSTSALLDCGFTAASAFWRVADNPLNLDALHISHFHGDHYFGIPALLVRSVEEGRTRPLTILGQSGVEERVRRLVNMAYRNVLDKARFDLRFIESAGGSKATVGDMHFSFAMADHPMDSLAVRVDSGGKALFYSGDGKPTEATRSLAQGCDMVVHEAFSLEPEKPGHGTVDSSIAFAREVGAPLLALVHIRRTVRRKNRLEIEKRITENSDITTLLPEHGERVRL